MKRSDILSLLTGMDAEKAKDAVDAILNLHNAELEEAKKNIDLSGYVKKEDYDKVLAEDKQLKSDSEKYKDYDRFVKFHDETIASQDKAKKGEAVMNLLKANKANEKAVPLLVKGVDLSAISLDKDGNIVDGNKIVDSLKSNYSSFFQTTQTSGAKPATPPAQDIPAKTYTHDDIEKMSRDEINANWKDIQASLQGQKKA